MNFLLTNNRFRNAILKLLDTRQELRIIHHFNTTLKSDPAFYNLMPP